MGGTIFRSENPEVQYKVPGKEVEYLTKESVQEIYNQIKEKGPLIEEISFSDNSYGVPAWEVLSTALTNCPNLKFADFSGIFNKRTMQEIPQSLTHLDFGLSQSRLLYLDLSDNAFGPEPARALVPLLKINTELQVFKLNNNGLGPEGAQIIFTALYETGCRLQVLQCGRNRLEDPGATALSKAIDQMKTLRELSIRQNGITAVGNSNVLQALKNNPDIEDLDLSDNWLNTKECKQILKETIQALPCLIKLDLSDCKMETVTELNEALSAQGSSEDFQVIKLDYNEIQNGLNELCALIHKKCKNIEVISLKGNEISEQEQTECKKIWEDNEGILGPFESEEEEEDESESSPEKAK